MSGEQLHAKLVSIGCPVSRSLEGSSFDYLFHDQAVLPFLDWLCNYVDTANVLQPQEIEDYESLVQSGVSILEGDDLDSALASFPQSDATPDLSEGELRNDIRRLKCEIEACEKEVGFLEGEKEVCNEEYSLLYTKTIKIASLIEVEETKFAEEMEDCLAIGNRRNDILDHLQTSAEKLGAKFDKVPLDDGNEHISKSKLKEFQNLEDEFNQRMKEYLQKQFFENIMNLSSAADPADDELFGLKIKDLPVSLVKGPKQEEYLFNCEEMHRLHALYPKSQLKLVDTLVSQDQAAACHQKIKSMFKDIRSDSFCVSPTALGQRNRELSNKLRVLQMQVTTCRTEIIQFINECADAERNKALTTDYSLKLLRQAYFNSKAKKALKYLWAQRARTELFVALLDKKLESHTMLKNCLDMTIDFLSQESYRSMKSKEMLTSLMSPAVLDIILESDNYTCTTLYRMLCDSSHQTIPKYSILLQCVNNFCGEQEKLDAAIAACMVQQTSFIGTMQMLRDSLEMAVFSDVSGGRKVCHSFKVPALPLTGLSDIVRLLNQLKLKSQQLESEVKNVLSYYKDKQKILHAQPFLQEERRLYGLFYSRNAGALGKPLAIKAELNAEALGKPLAIKAELSAEALGKTLVIKAEPNDIELVKPLAVKAELNAKALGKTLAIKAEPIDNNQT